MVVPIAHVDPKRTAQCQLCEEGNLPSPSPVGIHLGVVCDRTLNPIVGYRYMKVDSKPSYDLCQTEYDKLAREEQNQFERIPPPVTPRRTLLGLGAAGIAAAALRYASSAASLAPDPTLFYDDFVELPPLSPAEELVGIFFKPKIPATRETDPAARRWPLASANPSSDPIRIGRVPAAMADDFECDEACKQRIADRRALFEQSRTNRNRQDVLDLSRQRAALYNTTFKGASCIPGIPCL